MSALTVSLTARMGMLENAMYQFDELTSGPPDEPVGGRAIVHYLPAVYTAVRKAMGALRLSEKGRGYLIRVLSREVCELRARGKASVRFPSMRMGVTLEAGEGLLGLAALERLERDESVIVFFDRPPAIKLQLICNGRSTGHLEQPSFVAVDGGGVVLISLRQSADLRKSQDGESDRFRYTDGRWSDEAFQDAAEELGFRHEIWTSEDFDQRRVSNIRALMPYYREGDLTEESATSMELVRSVVHELGAPTISEVLEIEKKIFVADIFRAVVRGVVFCDLSACELTLHKEARIFSSTGRLEAFANCQSSMNAEWQDPSIEMLKTGERILWDGQIRTVLNAGINQITFDGHVVTSLDISNVRDLLAAGTIKRLEGTKKLAESRQQDAHDFLLQANPEHLAVANLRLKRIQPILAGLRTPNSRTERRYVASFNHAAEAFGNGFIGLIPAFEKCGDRERRLAAETVEVVINKVRSEYATIRNRNRQSVHAMVVIECETKNIPAPSYSWFCNYIKSLDQHALARARRGSKGAYQVQPVQTNFEAKEVSGEPIRSFERAHIDHTKIDLETIFEATGENLGRLWLTLLIDHGTRTVLAFYLSYESPSYRSAMMVLRNCVKKHQRLPDSIVVDGGKEFRSTWFQIFCAYFRVNLIYRPPAKPRFGSQIERMFGSINTMFLNHLAGNTQLTKNVRELTKDVDPKRTAVWTLPALEREFHNFFSLYDETSHRSILMSPKQARARSDQLFGEFSYRIIPYDEAFVIATFPFVEKGTAKVTKNGVKVNYFWFNDNLLFPYIGGRVKVRFDPFNLSIVVAYIHGGWVKLKSKHSALLNGFTESQLEAVAEIMRKRRKDVELIRLSDTALAKYLVELKDREDVLASAKKAASQASAYPDEIVGEDLGNLSDCKLAEFPANIAEETDGFADAEFEILQSYLDA